MDKLKAVPHTIHQLIFEYPQTGCALLIVAAALGLTVYVATRSWRQK